MVQAGACMSRFHFGFECKMQMTPSCDPFMTAVDSRRCSLRRDPVTPIRRSNLLSDLIHIGSIIQRAHQSCTHFFHAPLFLALYAVFFWLLMCFRYRLSSSYHSLFLSSSPHSTLRWNHCFPFIWPRFPLSPHVFYRRNADGTLCHSRLNQNVNEFVFFTFAAVDWHLRFRTNFVAGKV